MKRILVIAGLFGLIGVIAPLVNNLTGSSIITELDCGNASMDYYYSPLCSACQDTTPLIDDLISNGCNITKINVKEDYELALQHNIHHTPTLIYEDERLIGRFSILEVKDLINK